MMNKAIFWDFDGTLVLSNHLWSGSALKVLKQNGRQDVSFLDVHPLMKEAGFTWHTPEEDYTGLLGKHWWEHMYTELQKLYMRLDVSENNAYLYAKQTREKILDSKNYQIYEDTVDTLEEAMKRGYRNYILSNNFPELRSIIDSLDLSDYFADIIVSAEIGYDKPRPEIFEYAKKAANDPRKCFMVGDNPFADIYGAGLANIPSILVHNTAKTNANYSFKNLSEIIEIL